MDTGNFAVGVPTLTTTLRGMTRRQAERARQRDALGDVRRPAPDPVVALIRLLASLHDEEGDTVVDGLDNQQTWSGVDYPAEQFRSDANVLDGVELMGEGSVAEMLWARPSATVLGIDATGDRLFLGRAGFCGARVSLRLPPGVTGKQAQDALVAHLESRVPWNVRCEIERGRRRSVRGRAGGPRVRGDEDRDGGGLRAPLTTEGQGGSIPLCNVLADTYPDAEIMLLGVEEPRCLIHAPNESVDPRDRAHRAR